jgi:hypothetical protein
MGPFVERPMCFGIKVGVIWSAGRITTGLRYLYISGRFAITRCKFILLQKRLYIHILIGRI